MRNVCHVNCHLNLILPVGDSLEVCLDGRHAGLRRFRLIIAEMRNQLRNFQSDFGESEMKLIFALDAQNPESMNENSEFSKTGNV